MSAPDKAHELRALLTAAISFIVALLGWVGIAVAVMLFCMVLDYITGTWAAKAHAEWTSEKAREGLWHKLGEIVALLVAALCDIAVGVILSSAAAPLIGDYHHRGYITLIVAVWYIFTELGSILENAAKLGAPIPEKLIKGIGRLKKKADDVDPVPGKEDDPQGKK
jgi:toxin secretion/phage lysis holin